MFKVDYTYGGLPKKEYDAVIAENVRRKRTYYREYDPVIGDEEGEEGGGEEEPEGARGEGQKGLGEPQAAHPFGEDEEPAEHHQKLPVHPHEVPLRAEPPGEEEKPRRHQGPLGHGVAEEKGEEEPRGHEKPFAEKPGVEPVAQRGRGRKGSLTSGRPPRGSSGAPPRGRGWPRPRSGRRSPGWCSGRRAPPDAGPRGSQRWPW